METIRHNKANIVSVEVNPGKQALDIQLSSYLGHKLARSKSKLWIVSNDTDFDKVISFWHEQGYQNVERIVKLGDSALFEELDNAVEHFENLDVNTTDVQTIEVPAAKAVDDITPEMWKHIHKLIKSYGKTKDRKSRIHGELLKEYGQEQGLFIYKKIQPKLG